LVTDCGRRVAGGATRRAADRMWRRGHGRRWWWAAGPARRRCASHTVGGRVNDAVSARGALMIGRADGPAGRLIHHHGSGSFGPTRAERPADGACRGRMGGDRRRPHPHCTAPLYFVIPLVFTPVLLFLTDDFPNSLCIVFACLGKHGKMTLDNHACSCVNFCLMLGVHAFQF